MTNSLKRITKQISESFLIFILTTSLSHSQNAPSNSKEQVSIPDIEKIYLHTDRSYYNLGESLWYKAYLVYAYNNLLFNNSNILYVELISPDSKIIARNKTRLEEGLGHGDFKLTDSVGVKPGVYQIRAYTNWSRNFGKDFVFKKAFEIMDVFDRDANKMNKGSITDRKKATNKTIDETQNVFKTQFFPEGGSLIENIISVVAFKAVDNNGLPIEVKGEIFDSDKNVVALTKSLHDGMGKFQLKPIAGKEYHAKLTTLNGNEIEVPLPKVKKEGYLLSIKTRKGKQIVTIKTNQETLAKHPNAPVTVIGATRGITYFEGTQPLNSTTLSFEFPETNFAEGISQITLYDANLRPQSERLLYIEKNNDIKVEVTTDKNLYKPKEKVIVNISSKTNTGEAMPASFSLSSTDVNGIKETKNYGTNISSYFLMESDIRGSVYNPGYYFDHSNPKRLVYLDLLLLTQGWRDFLWKKMPKINDSLAYKVEKGITIAGTVKQLFGKKEKPNSNVTLALFNKGKVNMLNSVTDAVGRFKFENLVFMGEASMMLNTQNEKGKNRGMFVLDSLFLSPMSVDFKKDSIVYKPQNTVIKENVYKKHIMFNVAAENILDEVEIIAKKKKGPVSLYGNADNTYVIDEKTQHFSDIFQLIQFYIPGVTAIGSKVGFNRYGGQPANILIDGVEWEQENLRGINTDDVAKIEAFKGPSAAIFGAGGNGVIIIYTKEGVVNKSPKKMFHSITQKIEGLYDARIFYTPEDVENPSFEMDNREAIRNTLYWNPYIHPNENGTAEISYFNSEVSTTVKVTLEGITALGIPIVVRTNYTIENN